MAAEPAPFSTSRVVLAHADATFGFPEVRRGVLPVFRGADPEHFCLGGNPTADPSQQSAFLDGLPAFAELHDRLARAALPSVVVCHGATRGGGMLFPCLGTLAQHVEKAGLTGTLALKKSRRTPKL